MKFNKVFFGLFIFLLFTACQSSTNKTDGEKSKTRDEAPAPTLPASSGTTLFTGSIDDTPFTATHEVYANKIQEGNYYAVNATTNECSVTLHIPMDKGMGSFTCEGSFVDKKNGNKLYNTDAAAVTIEEKSEQYLSGSFTLLAADNDGNIKSVKEGRFKAMIK